MKRISCSRTSRSPTPPRLSGGATIGQRRRQHEVEPVECSVDLLPVLGPQPLGALDLGVPHREALLDLDPDVLAVGAAVLGEELPVDVRGLAHEDGVGRVVDQRQLDRAAAREAGRRLLDTFADERVGRAPSRRRRPRAPRATRARPARRTARARGASARIPPRRRRAVPPCRSSPRAASSPRATRAHGSACGRRRRSRRRGSGSSRPSRCRAPRRRARPRAPPPSRRSSRLRSGPGSAGLGTSPKCGFSDVVP